MCGIFGLIYQQNKAPAIDKLHKKVNKLFELSESRGREAAGLALSVKKGLKVYKVPCSASRMISSSDYKAFFTNSLLKSEYQSGDEVALLGHARLVTNGFQAIDINNQPIVSGGVVAVHNGIIINDLDLWGKAKTLKKKTEVDSEIFPVLMRHYMDEGMTIDHALKKIFLQIRGEATVAMLFNDLQEMLIATNTGSLYLFESSELGVVGFVSERFQAEQYIKTQASDSSSYKISKVKAGAAKLINLKTLKIQNINLKKSEEIKVKEVSSFTTLRSIEDKYASIEQARNDLKRCSRCILPETVPFISFDSDGVCNFCHNHQSANLLGEKNLLETLAYHRSVLLENNCMVALSGGRDSCFGLHQMVKQYQMKPVAYTYDWGMVTPLARRNQALMCGELGVEHIWVSADIRKKRENIRKNLLAWLKRPELGMIPLLMAGDKQFFYHANRISKQMNINLMVFSMNHLERTDFKSGFAGVPPNTSNGKHYQLTLMKKAALAFFYGKQFLLNPGYLNSSVLDTISAFGSYYFTKQNYLYLFDYIPWVETEVDALLIDQYGWEVAEDTSSTWRIGDGTAPFYNYVYYTVAGFSEFDTFRSNQIREGMITRKQALEKVTIENRPRWDSIKEYLQIINVNFDDTIKAIDSIPKLYYV